MKEKKVSKSWERAKAIRIAFAEGATAAQLIARYGLANSGVLGNILSGRRCPGAGGPIVKSTRVKKEKKASAPKAAKPRTVKAKAAAGPKERRGDGAGKSTFSQERLERIAAIQEEKCCTRQAAIRHLWAEEEKAAKSVPAPAAA